MNIIHEVESDAYGRYRMLCAGIVDYTMIAQKLGADGLEQWYWKYNHTKFFNGFMFYKLHNHILDNGKVSGGSRIALFVATKSINVDWDYKVIGKRKSHLPIAHDDQKVVKWRNSLPDGILTPAWLNNCHSLDDIKAADKIANPDPCPYCRTPK